jgi:hypothetical protein
MSILRSTDKKRPQLLRSSHLLLKTLGIGDFRLLLLSPLLSSLLQQPSKATSSMCAITEHAMNCGLDSSQSVAAHEMCNANEIETHHCDDHRVDYDAEKDVCRPPVTNNRSLSECNTSIPVVEAASTTLDVEARREPLPLMQNTGTRFFSVDHFIDNDDDASSCDTASPVADRCDINEQHMESSAADSRRTTTPVVLKTTPGPVTDESIDVTDKTYDDEESLDVEEGFPRVIYIRSHGISNFPYDVCMPPERSKQVNRPRLILSLFQKKLSLIDDDHEEFYKQTLVSL